MTPLFLVMWSLSLGATRRSLIICPLWSKLVCHVSCGYSICHSGKICHPTVWLFHLPQLAINICHPLKWLSICHIGKNICQPSIKCYNTLKWFSICHTWNQSSGTMSATINWQNICQAVMAITSAIIKINYEKYFIDTQTPIHLGVL